MFVLAFDTCSELLHEMNSTIKTVSVRRAFSLRHDALGEEHVGQHFQTTGKIIRPREVPIYPYGAT